MVNMKEFLLSKSFGEEQFDNELRFIVRHWFDDLLIEEKGLLSKGQGRYNAMYNGKEYYYYTFGNNKKFILVPRQEDLFLGDFDDIITFRKNEDSISLNIKNKTNNKFRDTIYTFHKKNDYVRCCANYKELNDKNNEIFKLSMDESCNPYNYFSSLQIRNCDYWYEGEIIRRPNMTKLTEKDSNKVKKIVKIDPSRVEEYSNSIPLTNLLDYRINKEYGVKRHLSL